MPGSRKDAYNSSNLGEISGTTPNSRKNEKKCTSPGCCFSSTYGGCDYQKEKILLKIFRANKTLYLDQVSSTITDKSKREKAAIQLIPDSAVNNYLRSVCMNFKTN